MADPLHVPRQRVSVRLQLADGRSVAGDAYVAIDTGDGHVEQLGDRLNNASERFLPIAVGDRHLLVRKAAIVSALTSSPTGAAANPVARPARVIRVEVRLSVGEPATGDLFVANPRANDRALDYLNRINGDFVALMDRDGMTLVNTHYVVAVMEQPDHHRPTARADSAIAFEDARSVAGSDGSN